VLQDRQSKRKGRSPKAPGVSLKAALREVDKVYDAYGHATFSRAEMATAMGMSPASGALLNKIGAIREYGLLAGRGAAMQVSDLYRSLHGALQAGGEDTREHALAAIRSAAAFRLLLEEFPNRIPDLPVIAMRLENKERFNRVRARIVADAFRSSLAEFGLIDSSGNLVEVLPKPDADSAGLPVGERPEAIPTIGPMSVPGSFRVEIPLSAGRKAAMTLPDDLSEADVARIRAVLRGYVSPE